MVIRARLEEQCQAIKNYLGTPTEVGNMGASTYLFAEMRTYDAENMKNREPTAATHVSETGSRGSRFWARSLETFAWEITLPIIKKYDSNIAKQHRENKECYRSAGCLLSSINIAANPYSLATAYL